MFLSLLVPHILRKCVRYGGDDLGPRARAGAEELHDELLADARVEAFLPHVLFMSSDDSCDFRGQGELRIAAFDKASAAQGPGLLACDRTPFLYEVKHKDCFEVHFWFRGEQLGICLV